jgi:hypothetical protein
MIEEENDDDDRHDTCISNQEAMRSRQIAERLGEIDG